MAEMLAHVVAFGFAFLMAMLFVGAGKGMALLFGIQASRHWLVISLVLGLILYWYMRYATRIRLENRALKTALRGLVAKHEDADEEEAAELVEDLAHPPSEEDLEEMAANLLEAGVAEETADAAEADGPDEAPAEPAGSGEGEDAAAAEDADEEE